MRFPGMGRTVHVLKDRKQKARAARPVLRLSRARRHTPSPGSRGRATAGKRGVSSVLQGRRGRGRVPVESDTARVPQPVATRGAHGGAARPGRRARTAGGTDGVEGRGADTGRAALCPGAPRGRRRRAPAETWGNLRLCLASPPGEAALPTLGRVPVHFRTRGCCPGLRPRVQAPTSRGLCGGLAEPPSPLTQSLSQPLCLARPPAQKETEASFRGPQPWDNSHVLPGGRRPPAPASDPATRTHGNAMCTIGDRFQRSRPESAASSRKQEGENQFPLSQ